MINIKRKILVCFASFFLVLLQSACTRTGTVLHMKSVPPNQIIEVPERGKSMVIFLRPYSKGYLIQSSVFKITKEKPVLIGIVAAMKKVAYQLEPGEHFFMVIGENAWFMSAKLEANRTYFAVIVPRMGWWKARFALRPVHANKLNSKELDIWLERSMWVEKNSESDLWARNNMNSIQSKYYEYFEDWSESSEEEKPKLQPYDGKLNKTLQMEPTKLEDVDLKHYYSPQDAVDSLDTGEYEYYSPQDSIKSLEEDAVNN